MQEINKKSHLATIIGSLDKLYNQAIISGQMNPEEIYYLSAIYKLLDSCSAEITYEQRTSLISIYNKLRYTSNSVCPSVLQEYIIEPKSVFVQSTIDDCLELPRFDQILYWQESDYNNTIDDIRPEIKNRVKLSDTYSNFAIGKIIDYTKIGRICFLLNGETSIDYSVIGEFNLDISLSFDIVFIEELNSVLIVSNNIYSHGDTFIKIIKKASVPSGIFDETFDNTFE